ncbi:MAG: ATPase, T2SS/T4P/T4SS family [Planctomycetota bacterium]|nr:ATPase, T2SS/T4P/T4SS family [Planctomycetota bacterium]
MKWRLNPIRGEVDAVDLGGKPVTFGRHPDNVVKLVDDLCSRFHCVVEPDGRGGVTVKDLGSRNGTKLNDVRIAKATTLTAGDVLRIGSFEFLVEANDASNMPGKVADLGDSAVEMEAGEDRGEQRPAFVTPDALKGADKNKPWAAGLSEVLEGLPPKAEPERVALVDAGGAGSAALAGTADGPSAMRMLLQVSSKARATDIHIEPKGEHYHVRMRVDGQMVDIVDLPNRVGELVYGLVKTAAQMKLAGREAVQEGHYSARFADRRVEYRVSFTPSVHGQKLVLRVLDERGIPHSLNDLGLAPYMVERVRRVCTQDAGLLLVCGPTGSGKTTTLYNALREIDRQTRNVVTIEDPVEYQLDNVTQIPIDEHKGNTFGALLRSVLRQDPDVILVGEIRDEETARTAMQAAMTGHVVYSSIHAKDTIAAVFRLLDLKVEPYLVANSLDLVLAQRLVRLLCDTCKRETVLSPGQSTRVGKFVQNRTQVYVATGCIRCLKTGFRGRRAIFELLDFNDELRDVVLKEPTITAMKRVIEAGLFTTLVQFGWRLVAEGVTTLDEIDRVAGQS